MKRLERLQEKLAAVRVERARQMQFIGERLGVFARLRDLLRDERRYLRAIEKLAMLDAAQKGAGQP